MRREKFRPNGSPHRAALDFLNGMNRELPISALSGLHVDFNFASDDSRHSLLIPLIATSWLLAVFTKVYQRGRGSSSVRGFVGMAISLLHQPNGLNERVATCGDAISDERQ